MKLKTASALFLATVIVSACGQTGSTSATTSTSKVSLTDLDAASSSTGTSTSTSTSTGSSSQCQPGEPPPGPKLDACQTDAATYLRVGHVADASDDAAADPGTRRHAAGRSVGGDHQLSDDEFIVAFDGVSDGGERIAGSTSGPALGRRPRRRTRWRRT